MSNNTNTKNKALSKFLNIKELSAILSVKPSTLYSWVYLRYIPFVKIGRLVRFDLEEIEVWLGQKKHCPGRANYRPVVDLQKSV